MADSRDWRVAAFETRYSGRAMPWQAFGSEITAFRFFEFTRFTGGEFWCMLRRLATSYGENEVVVATPRYQDLERHGFGDAAFATVPVCSSSDDYHARISRQFRNQRGLAFDLYSTMEIAIYGRSSNWAFWGEREFSIMVAGFATAPPSAFAQWCAECNLRLQTAEEVLEETRLDFRIDPNWPPRPDMVPKFNAFRAEFLANYDRR